MRCWTAAGSMPPSRGAPLLVALSALWLLGVPQPGAARRSICGVSERQSRWGMDIEAKDLPKWWLPLFSPVELNPVDGQLCGFGLRLARGYFLAHTQAVDRIVELQKETGKKAGMFRFVPDTTIDLASPLLHDDVYVPTLTDTFERDIGLYRVDIRPGAGPGAQPVHMRYPLWTSVCLQVDKDAKQKNCRLVTYGDDRFGGAGSRPNGTRRLKVVGVVETGCDGAICFMRTLSAGNRSGSLCGVYSNMGNPIICGDGPLEKVTYLFWRMNSKASGGLSPTRLSNCSTTFRAVKVAHIASRVWNVHTGHIQS